MPQVAVYAPGTPMWVDLSSSDVEAAKTFYGGLFGWKADPIPDPQAGGYTMFTLGDKLVAGVGPIQNPGQPPTWAMYVATENADETAQKVTQAGGKVIMPPMDVMEAGRMAIFADPSGAVFGVWQPGQHQGAGIVNEPNSLCWNELNTPNVETIKGFYNTVFGWEGDTHAMGDGEYTEWKLNDKSIGGAMPMPQQVPSGTPPFWMTYFAVENCDAAVEKTQQLGGKVLMPAMDIEPGRFAVLADPQGAVFAVITMKPMPNA